MAKETAEEKLIRENDEAGKAQLKQRKDDYLKNCAFEETKAPAKPEEKKK